MISCGFSVLELNFRMLTVVIAVNNCCLCVLGSESGLWWISPVIIVLYLASLPYFVWLTSKNPLTYEVLQTGWVPVLSAMGISR